MNPNCNGGSTGLGTDADADYTLPSGAGDRRFVAYAATPTAAGPAGGTLTLLPGVPGSSTPAGTGGTIPGFCNTQDGGTKIDIYTFVVATTGTGPIAIDNIKYDVGRGTGIANNAGATTRAHSTTTGPVRQYIFFTNVTTAVTTLYKLSTANQALAAVTNPATQIGDSNAWITTIGMTGPPKSFAVTTGTNLTKTISGITITEFVTDAFGVASTANNTFCIDIASGNATFGASPSLSVTGSGLATDLLQRIRRSRLDRPRRREHPGVDHHLQQPGERAVLAHAEQPGAEHQRRHGWLGARDPHRLRRSVRSWRLAAWHERRHDSAHSGSVPAGGESGPTRRLMRSVVHWQLPVPPAGNSRSPARHRSRGEQLLRQHLNRWVQLHRKLLRSERQRERPQPGRAVLPPPG